MIYKIVYYFKYKYNILYLKNDQDCCYIMIYDDEWGYYDFEDNLATITNNYFLII